MFLASGDPSFNHFKLFRWEFKIVYWQYYYIFLKQLSKFNLKKFNNEIVQKFY